jgi:hypothetical protein
MPGMRRTLAPVVSLLFLAALLMPSVVLLQFKLDQARIEKELCVQREVIDEMRTCHGECQLTKRFKALEQEAEAGFPAERVQVRYEPVVDVAPEAAVLLAPVTDRVMPDPLFRTSDGHGRGTDHVPRA